MTELTLMDKYAELQHADAALDTAVAVAVGGADWWKPDSKGLPFADWWFDTYDSSVELVETEPDWRPTAEHLEAFRLVGILTVFVSYQGGEALMWYYRNRGWMDGQCSPRSTDRDIREAQRAKAEHAQVKAERDRLTDTYNRLLELLRDAEPSITQDRDQFDADAWSQHDSVVERLRAVLKNARR